MGQQVNPILVQTYYQKILLHDNLMQFLSFKIVHELGIRFAVKQRFYGHLLYNWNKMFLYRLTPTQVNFGSCFEDLLNRYFIWCRFFVTWFSVFLTF